MKTKRTKKSDNVAHKAEIYQIIESPEFIYDYGEIIHKIWPDVKEDTYEWKYHYQYIYLQSSNLDKKRRKEYHADIETRDGRCVKTLVKQGNSPYVIACRLYGHLGEEHENFKDCLNLATRIEQYLQRKAFLKKYYHECWVASQAKIAADAKQAKIENKLKDAEIKKLLRKGYEVSEVLEKLWPDSHDDARFWHYNYIYQIWYNKRY